ncbi:MAG: DUF2461 domain-containing protein [Oscillospiraceae bacterium]|jgi:uncharacterized protein (TIGR02453 family)|nr:DUF2461 domain-containing protein [Oscillospiraceae bacterium]
MPFKGFTQATIDFMWELRLNNNKAWFEAHKDAYKRDLLSPMKELGREVFERISESFGGRDFFFKVSRIYKDARRLHGSAPYRDHLWFSIERPSEEWTTNPVFWFELSPTDWSCGMGFYMARPETMAKLRARIDDNPKKFEEFAAPLESQNEFVLEGEEYVRRKAAPSQKTEAWYNKKTFSLIHYGKIEAEVFTPALSNRIVNGFTVLMPFYDYFISLNADPTPKA